MSEPIKLWMWSTGDRQLHNMPSPVVIHTEYRALPVAEYERMEKLAAMKWVELEEERIELSGKMDRHDIAVYAVEDSKKRLAEIEELLK